MGLLDKLFGNKPSATDPSGRKGGHAPTVKSLDPSGRTVEVSREEWGKSLPTRFQKAWDSPDELAGLIDTCLRHGFVTESLDPARQLSRIDSNPKRGANLLGATLLELHRYHEAEKMMVEALRQHGDDASLLTNLAKSFAGRGEQDRAERALWRGLEIDPNQESGLQWFAARQRERGGPKAELAAIQRVAALPGSWRADLLLARRSLDSKDVPGGLKLYQETLSRLDPLPSDALKQAVGDLAGHGLRKEITEICAARFNAGQHGFQVGDPLLKSYVEQHDVPNARRILEQLAAQQKPDWREHLEEWEREIDKLERPPAPVVVPAKTAPPVISPTKPEPPVTSVAEPEPPATPQKTEPPATPQSIAPPPMPVKLNVEPLVLDGPLWSQEEHPFAKLLPDKPDDAVRIAFVCGSAQVTPETPDDPSAISQTDAVERFSRGLPMFLAERLHIKTSANAITLVPRSKSGVFILPGVPWTTEALENMERKPDYIVLLHVVAVADPWQAHFTIIRQADQKTTAGWRQAVDPKNSAEAINEMTKRVFRELKSTPHVSSAGGATALYPPTISQLPNYVTALERALAIFCAAPASESTSDPTAERGTFEALLNLCSRETDNVTMRLLLLGTIQRASRASSDVAREFRAKIERLQRAHPLPEPAQGLAQNALARIFTEAAPPAN